MLEAAWMHTPALDHPGILYDGDILVMDETRNHILDFIHSHDPKRSWRSTAVG